LSISEIIAVKKEYESPEYFAQLDKNSEASDLDVKSVHKKKKGKSLSSDSLTLKDAFSFESILSDKIIEKKDLNKEIKSLLKFAEKDKSLILTQDLKQDNAVSDLFPLQPLQLDIKAESLAAVAVNNIELTGVKLESDDSLKEEISLSENIVSQLLEANPFEKNPFEKNSIERSALNSMSNHLNQNNSVEKNVNLKENNELNNGKEKKEFFKVVDLRTNSDAREGRSLRVSSEKENSEVSQASRFAYSNNSNNSISQNSADIKDLPAASQVQLSTGKMQQFDSSLMSTKNGNSPFHNQLIEYLRESGNTSIVRNANIILKENNEGEIKLLMKPENLGYVRIKLMLSDSHIVGRIIVDNYSIKEIFENNLDNLIKNFKENGYSSAMIDVSVGGEQNNNKKQSVENERVLALKEIEKIDEHSIVRTMLEENRLVDMVI